MSENYLYIQCKDHDFGWRECQTLRVPWTRLEFERLRAIVIDGMTLDDRAAIGGVMSGQAAHYLEQGGVSRAKVRELQSQIETQHGDFVGVYSFLGYIMCLTVRVRLNDPRAPARIGDPAEKPRWSRPCKGYADRITEKNNRRSAIKSAEK